MSWHGKSNQFITFTSFFSCLHPFSMLSFGKMNYKWQTTQCTSLCGIGIKNNIFLLPKLSHRTSSQKWERSSSSQNRSKRENRRVRNWSRSNGQMEMRWEVENASIRHINIEFVSITAPMPKQLNLIVWIFDHSGRSCHALMEAVTRILGLIQTNDCQTMFKERDE